MDSVMSDTTPIKLSRFDFPQQAKAAPLSRSESNASHVTTSFKVPKRTVANIKKRAEEIINTTHE